MTTLNQLEKAIGINFKDKKLLQNAFIHRSFLNESRGISLQSNERLEFLGDAVLELATSKFLFNTLPDKPEGELTSLRSSLVKTQTLADVAKALKLGKLLKMSKGENQSGGRENSSLLANTIEALIGAIYLDQGFKAVEAFTSKHLFPKLDEIIELKLDRDFKSTLQEHIQSKGNPTPTYHVLREVGPDHQKTFTIAVKVKTKTLGKGTGPSKQQAQQHAAQDALEKLTTK